MSSSSAIASGEVLEDTILDGTKAVANVAPIVNRETIFKIMLIVVLLEYGSSKRWYSLLKVEIECWIGTEMLCFFFLLLPFFEHVYVTHEQRYRVMYVQTNRQIRYLF
jgi:hypothetical protein